VRALFSTQPGFGHLNPFLPYAIALREAGHDVLFASSASFAGAIEQHGFSCEPIGVDFTWETVMDTFPEFMEAIRAGRRDEFATFDINWGRWTPKAVRDLAKLCDRWRPDVIVREFAELAAGFAGEMTGVPVVCAAWGAPPFDGSSWRMMYDWDRHLACYTAMRAELGLPADEPGGASRRQPTFTVLPPSWFRRPDPDVTLRHFRMAPTEGPAQTAPPWLANLGEDRPFIYATLGTVYNKGRRLRGTMLEALGDLDADVLMTVGRDVDPSDIDGVPANVRLERYVPQSLVLERASLVISHGGLGTMLGSVYAGVPMVLIAIGADQPMNARRASELGLALATGYDGATARWLREAAHEVLRNGSYRTTARAFRDECDQMEPVETAVATLEQIAASKLA
jgi:UDP:flavonoid glycosyltransferase YjiC (YdhE family)